jgi:hypothetical protein
MNQSKLTKSEWNAVEIPVSPDELSILKFIQRAFENPEMIENSMKTLYTYLKLEPSPQLDSHLCQKYFNVCNLPKTTMVLKKADKIRLDTTATTITEPLYETVLLELCKSKNYFQVQWMLTLHVKHPNPHVINYASQCLQSHVPDIRELTMNAVNLLEKNKYIQYKDTELYSHQKEIFNLAKLDEPKLILYVAPTGTGKTMTPIGLSQKYRVIFVCAAKHVGLALMRACISIGKPCGVAFGCSSKEDIRLHNSAALKFTRDKKSGTIRKVDNSLGEKVEVLVCDLQSYIYAEEYMLDFFKPHQILKYWDEPTISMDEEDHEFHPIIQRNWKSHKIPNIVLSSATLPKINYRELTSLTVHEIYSYESSKTIQVLSPDNCIVLPHQYCETQEELSQCIQHLEENLILLKYIDLSAILDYMKDKPIPFKTMKDISIMAIKKHYLELLKEHVVDYAASQKSRIQMPSTIQICSTDAWTCSHGPTMYVVDDVKKIVSYFLKSSAIPSEIMSDLMKNLTHNNEISERIGRIEKDIQDSNKDDGKEKKMGENRVSDDVKRLQHELMRLQSSIKPIVLPDKFIPNKYDHLKRFDHLDKLSMAYTSSVEPEIIEKVLGLEVDTAWKVMLMMGIAVFVKDVNPKYMEIVKELTSKEKMFAVFATKDFIFGTNYQFANLFIGKDLASKITQEKIIQTAGRVGRGKQVPYSIRLRDESFIKKLFMPQPSIEGDVMMRLYS